MAFLSDWRLNRLKKGSFAASSLGVVELRVTENDHRPGC